MRRRFLRFWAIVFVALGANVVLDYWLIVRNPDEMEEIVRTTLGNLLPEYTPRLGEVELLSWEQGLVIGEFVLHERGNPGREWLRVGRAEAVVSLVPPAVTELRLIDPEITLRIGPDGQLTPAPPTGEGGETTLYADLNLKVEGGRVRVIADLPEGRRDVLLSGITVDALLREDLSLETRGRARLGALFGSDDPLAAGGRALSGVPPDRLHRDLFPQVEFKVVADEQGSVDAKVDLRDGELNRVVRSMIPRLFQEKVWDEIGPQSGHVDVSLDVTHTARHGLKVSGSIRPQQATVRPRGFSIPIEDIQGAFEVVVAVPPGADAPEILNVSWENTLARVGETGRLVARGSAFPGKEDENLTLFIAIDVREIELSEAFRRALPPDIRRVYEEFDPRGTVGGAKVVIFKGPHMEDPQISAQVHDLGGTVSAMYRDYPIRFLDAQGSFSLAEGANVEVRATGQLEFGGVAEVEAMVMHGDLIHVDVDARGVPVTAALLSALPEGTRRFVEPFHPRAGSFDARIKVAKAGPRAEATPRVSLTLHELELAPELFPLPLVADGTLVIAPEILPGQDDDEESVPARVDLTLDVKARSVDGAIRDALVRGPLVVRPRQGEFSGDLQVDVRAAELTQRVLDAAPPELQGLRRLLRPRGEVQGVRARVRALDRFEVSGTGTSLSLAPSLDEAAQERDLAGEQAPLRVDLTRFSLAREGARVRVLEASGRRGSGSFSLDGEVEVAEEPLLHLDLRAQDVELDAALLSVLPAGEGRELLEAAEPQGVVDVEAALRQVPGRPAGHRITLHPRDASLRAAPFHPKLAGFGATRVTDLRGDVEVRIGEALRFRAVQGTLAGAELVIDGSVGLGDARRVQLALGVDGLELDATLREQLAPALGDVLEAYPAEGPLDAALTLDVDGERDPRVDVRLVPRGLRVRPRLLPVPLTDVQGELRIVDGEPELIDLRCRLQDGTLTLRRDQAKQDWFPQGGDKGHVIRIEGTGLGYGEDPARRQELIGTLPTRWQEILRALEPEGTLDLSAALYVPYDLSEGALSYVAEVRPQGFGFQLRETKPLELDHVSPGAIRVRGAQGVIRLTGRVEELALATAEGEILLDRMRLFDQTLFDVHAPLILRNGTFQIGRAGAPLSGTLWGGDLATIVEFTPRSGYYRGSLDLRKGSLVDVKAGLLRIGSEDAPTPTKAPAARAGQPLSGWASANLQFHGGSRQGRTTLPFSGAGKIWVGEANLVELPRAFDVVRILEDAFSGETSDPLAFETIVVDYTLSASRLSLTEVRLDSSKVDYVGRNGYVLFGDDADTSGRISLDLVPFDTGGNIWERVLIENIVPGTGVSVRGSLWGPNAPPSVRPFPFFKLGEQLLDLFGFGDEAPEERGLEEDEPETPEDGAAPPPDEQQPEDADQRR